MAGLTANQAAFAQSFAQTSGLNPNVVEAWVIQENAGGSSNGANNWLGIGITGSGSFGNTDSIWANPIAAGKASAEWLMGKASIPGYGIASSGIQAIDSTKAEAPSAQIAAIQGSGWASGGEVSLATIYDEITGQKFVASPPVIGGVPGKIALGIGTAGTALLAPEVGLGSLLEDALGGADLGAGAATGATAAGESAALGSSAVSNLTTAGGILAGFELFKDWFPKALLYAGLLFLGLLLFYAAVHRETGLSVPKVGV